MYPIAMSCALVAGKYDLNRSMNEEPLQLRTCLELPNRLMRSVRLCGQWVRAMLLGASSKDYVNNNHALVNYIQVRPKLHIPA